MCLRDLLVDWTQLRKNISVLEDIVKTSKTEAKEKMGWKRKTEQNMKRLCNN